MYAKDGEDVIFIMAVRWPVFVGRGGFQVVIVSSGGGGWGLDEVMEGAGGLACVEVSSGLVCVSEAVTRL